MTTEDCTPWLNEIDWDMIHEDAVTRYLEWGNNNFLDDLRRPVTLSGEYSIYFVIDTWREPKVVLTRMNNYGAESLCEKLLPPELADPYMASIGGVRGIHEPSQAIKDWLKTEMERKLGKPICD